MKLVFVLALFVTAVLTACQLTPHRDEKRQPATAGSVTQPYLTGAEDLPPTELGEVWGPDNVDQTNKIVGIFMTKLKADTKPGSVMRRDAHPKHHACVAAHLTIDNKNLPPDLRVGLYANNAKYDAWIRFSNADPSGDAKSDIELDQHGMAVKILGAPASPTGNQDLVMMDDERFFSKDGENYIPMTEALLSGGLQMVTFLATHPHQAEVLISSRHHAASPLTQRYYSSVPYKLGPKSSRFSMQPCGVNNLFPDLPDAATAPKNYLRDRLVKTVAKQATCFDFYVQPNNDPDNNSVEDPTIIWDHTKSPMVLVGHLEIPQQEGLLSNEQMNFCENISMDPWRAPSENRPLGQINRIRKLAYPMISRLRHKTNARAQIEPHDLNPCSGASADLCLPRR